MTTTELNPTPPDARTAGSQQQEVGMRYWHEITAEEQREIMKSSGITWGEFLKRYQQPDWCNYPDALGGPMGCWSLLTVGKIKTAESCKGCDECTAKHPNAALSHAATTQKDTNAKLLSTAKRSRVGFSKWFSALPQMRKDRP